MAIGNITGRGNRFQDLTGRHFGWLTVESFSRSDNGRIYWHCRCVCGKLIERLAIILKRPTKQSCGCRLREAIGTAHITHGHTMGGAPTPTYRSWRKMVERCHDQKNNRYAEYGGRGISVCERWQDFSNFLADMGTRPDKHSIERIDNRGNYEPTNCHWATPKAQARNKRNNAMITFRGETLSRAEWAERTGIPYTALYERIERRGWSIERALTTPAMPVGHPKKC